MNRRLLSVLAIAFALLPSVARAHPLHTTLTEISVAADGTLRVRVRAFADDFSGAVSRFTGSRARADHRVADADAARYIGTAVTISRTGAPVPLSFIMQQRDGDATWFEFQAPAGPLRGLRVRSALLLEYHADQVNIVKATYGATRFTTLFSRGDGDKGIP